MEQNISQAREHIRLLTGDAKTPVTFQLFYDPKNGVKKPELAKHFLGNLDDNLQYFKEMQDTFLCGVYITVNETDGRGRQESNVKNYRSVFADWDGITQPDWGLQPSLVTERDNTHGHTYWRVSDLTTADEFREIQKTISIKFGTDKQVTDPNRVLRLCGFNHLKNPENPVQYSIQSSSENIYTVEQLRGAFALNAQQDAELRNWLSTRAGIQTGTGYEHSEKYNTQFINWLTTNAPIAYEGSGTETMIRVASYAHDYGIPLKETQEMMWEHYNPRCEPVWTPQMQYHFDDTIKNAYTYANSSAGCRTIKAAFGSMEALPERIDGWVDSKDAIDVDTESEKDDENPFFYRLNFDKATVSHAALNSKSAHYDLARAFDGIKYDGKKILRCDKIFYLFNGICYEKISDDFIKSIIQRFYSEFKPSEALTNGIFNVFCNLVNIKFIENGCWLDNSGRESKNVILFTNGLIDLSKPTLKLEPHTHLYFSFNQVGYAYDPTAKAPLFKAFLIQVLPNIKDREMLQEWFGYCMTTDVKLQKFLILIGKSRAGKGVITDLLRHIVGKGNVIAPTLSRLTTDSTLAEMSTKSLALIPDAHSVAFAQRDATVSSIKAITGGDAMSYHVIWKGTQTSVIATRIVMTTNNMPEFVDSSGALAHRMLVLLFKKSWAGKEDVDLLSKLKKEIAGIAQWALEGKARLDKTNKFTESEAGLLEKEEMREDMFPLSQFISSSCIVQDEAIETVDALFNSYRHWAGLTGIKSPMTKIAFSKTLKNSPFDILSVRPRVDGVQLRAFKGIELNETSLKQLSVNVNKFNPVPPPEKLQ